MAKILVQYPPAIIPKSANIPFTVAPAGLLEFNLGGVVSQQNGFIFIDDSVACNATIRTTQCITATIYPRDPCPILNPLWSGANLTLAGNCLRNGHVLFTIKNIGGGHLHFNHTWKKSQLLESRKSDSRNPPHPGKAAGRNLHINYPKG